MQINKLILETSLISHLKSFYSSVLGVKVLNQEQKNFTLDFGSTHVVFRESENYENPFYHFAFNIPSNKIEEACEWLQEKVQLLWLEEYNSYIADFRNWKAKSVYFFDPAGNIVELISRFDLNDYSMDVFDMDQVRNVSEIGLVFPDEYLDDEAKKLMNEFNLRYFEKQPPLQHFRAIGNDEGLFIVVPENRNWYPTTDSLSKIFPLQIIFNNGGTEYSFESGDLGMA